jgi:hypothetical protein
MWFERGADALEVRSPRALSREIRGGMATRAIASPTIPSKHYLNATYGIRSWLLTTDHKRIALLYLASVTFFFMLGGIFAFLIRLNLLTPQAPWLLPKPTTSFSPCMAWP